jgi:nucleoside permease NupC
MPAPMLQSLQSVLGIIAFVAVAWTVSEDRR